MFHILQYYHDARLAMDLFSGIVLSLLLQTFHQNHSLVMRKVVSLAHSLERDALTELS